MLAALLGNRRPAFRIPSTSPSIAPGIRGKNDISEEREANSVKSSSLGVF